MQAKPSFKDFLNTQIDNIKSNYQPVVAMDLDSQNPATHRLIKHSAKRVIHQHKKELEALKDK